MLKKHIKATNIELTEAIKEYLEKKIDSLLKFIKEDEEVLAEIEVGKTTHHHHKGDVFRAEVNVHFKDRQLRAEAVEDDLYKAIDKVKDEIVREVKNVKEKKGDLLKRGKQKIKNFLKQV